VRVLIRTLVTSICAVVLLQSLAHYTRGARGNTVPALGGESNSYSYKGQNPAVAAAVFALRGRSMTTWT
jgi:hypothetical protein